MDLRMREKTFDSNQKHFRFRLAFFSIRNHNTSLKCVLIFSLERKTALFLMKFSFICLLSPQSSKNMLFLSIFHGTNDRKHPLTGEAKIPVLPYCLLSPKKKECEFFHKWDWFFWKEGAFSFLYVQNLFVLSSQTSKIDLWSWH